MDTSLYISYECFKEKPEYGIIAKLKDGQEIFYQIMASSHKVIHSDWNDIHLVKQMNKEDIVSYTKLEKYVEENNLGAEMDHPSLFFKLVKKYNISDNMIVSIANDMERMVNMTQNVEVPVKTAVKVRY